MDKSDIHFTFPAALAASRTCSMNGRLSRGLFRNRQYRSILLFFLQCHPIRSWHILRIPAYLSTAGPVFSPRILITLGHETCPDFGYCQTPRRHPYMSSFSLSALIKDGSSCVHNRHFQT